MQITDLNKIIKLFLVGSLSLIVFIFLWMGDIQEYYTKHFGATNNDPSASVITLVATLSFISAAMLIGVIVDAISGFAVRTCFRWLSENKIAIKFLLSTNTFAKKSVDDNDGSL